MHFMLHAKLVVKFSMGDVYLPQISIIFYRLKRQIALEILALTLEINKFHPLEVIIILIINYSIWIFTHLMLCLADATHNFKWLKIMHICKIWF